MVQLNSYSDLRKTNALVSFGIAYHACPGFSQVCDDLPDYQPATEY